MHYSTHGLFQEAIRSVLSVMSLMRLPFHLTAFLALLLVVSSVAGGEETANNGTATGKNTRAKSSLPPAIRSETPTVKQFDNLDPLVTGWTTEAFHEAAKSQLKKLAKLAAHPDTLDEDSFESIVAENLICAASLGRVDLKLVNQLGQFEIRRTATKPGEQQKAAEATGPRAFVHAIQNSLSQFDSAGNIRIAFKTFGINQVERDIVTREYVQVYGPAKTGSIQQNSVWVCRWRTPGQDKSQLVLAEIAVEDFAEITYRAKRPHAFSDCTEAVLARNPSFEKQIVHGHDYWRRRLQKTVGIDVAGYQGLAVGDVNGDGLDDVYSFTSGGLPNRLYVQQDDGTAVDASRESRLDFLDRTSAGLFVDFDNDGDQDLVTATDRFLLFLWNDGEGRFTIGEVKNTDAIAYSFAAADFDNDGDLDVYLCGNARADQPMSGGETAPLPWHDANNGAANSLYRNNGDWTFTDVTSQVGLNQNNSRFSWAAAWEDYDNDGDMDLYVANDFGRNNLYRNDKGRFSDVAAAAGVEDISAGMSVSWGDYNGDGWMDLYVSNMFSSAGNRITYQRKFRESADSETLRQFQRHARGNSLFENNRDGTFRDVSVEAGVTMGRWAWASSFADINNDGWEDLFVTNGFVTQDNDRDL